MSDNPSRSALQVWMPVFRIFGSVRIAMFLLGVVIIACITGTIVESRLDTSVAQAYVYESPWFGAWLTLLCINLLFATFTRLPWKRRHVGFIITHIGIITILAGAMIGRIWGTEGHITLSKDDEPASALISYDQVVEATFSNSERSQMVPISTNLRLPTEKHPITLHSKDIKVEVVGYSEHLVAQAVISPAKGDGPRAIHLGMESSMVGRPLDYWLVQDDPQRQSASLGVATVRFNSDPKDTSKTSSSTSKGSSSVERHFAFAKMPGMNIIHQLSGAPTGIKATFHFQEGSAPSGNDRGFLEITANGKRSEFSVVKMSGKTVSIPDTKLTLRILQYFPDFRMKDKVPISVSDQPNNPALLFEVIGLPGSGSAVAPASNDVHGGGMSPDMGREDSASSVLQIYVNRSGKFRYEARSKKHGFAQGNIEPGKNFSLNGWADWQFKITEQVEHAEVRDELAPMTTNMGQQDEGSGVCIEVSKGDTKVRRWVVLGNQERFQLDQGEVSVGFGHRNIPLPFTVALESFEVEHDEGTMNPAGFKSHVIFVDPKNPTPVRRQIWMNHPANFPDYPGVGLLGTAYKFSRASWNPNDLNQTTLQVLRDPGWSLKWIGSLLLCMGIATMFYLKPSRKG